MTLLYSVIKDRNIFKKPVQKTLVRQKIVYLKNSLTLPLEHNFEKKSPDIVDSLGSPYDPQSIMHYTRMQFATKDAIKKNLPTMEWKANPKKKLGGFKLSNSDIYQIRKHYNCPEIITTPDPVKGILKLLSDYFLTTVSKLLKNVKKAFGLKSLPYL